MLENSLNSCFWFPQCIVTVDQLWYVESASNESKRFETAVLIFQRDGRNDDGLSPLEDWRVQRLQFFHNFHHRRRHALSTDIYYSSSVLPVFVSRRKRPARRKHGQSIELSLSIASTITCIIVLWFYMFSFPNPQIHPSISKSIRSRHE